MISHYYYYYWLHLFFNKYKVVLRVFLLNVKRKALVLERIWGKWNAGKFVVCRNREISLKTFIKVGQSFLEANISQETPPVLA